MQIIFCTRQRDAIYSRDVVSFWWSSVTKTIFENVTNSISFFRNQLFIWKVAGFRAPPKMSNDSQKQPFRGILGKGVLKICSKFTGEHPCQSVISMQFSWYHFSTEVYSCKFAACCQNIISYGHLSWAAPEKSPWFPLSKWKWWFEFIKKYIDCWHFC